MSTDLFIFAVLLLINALMTLAMLIAARSLGQPGMARLLAGAFGYNVLLYASDAVYVFYFRGNPWVNVLVSAIALIPPNFAAVAYRYRSGLPLRLRWLAAGWLAALMVILWFTFIQPNKGLSGSVVPFYAAVVLTYGTTALLRPGRKLLLGERPILVTVFAMAAIETAGGVVLAAMGNGKSPMLDQAYMFLIFLGLPAMTVAAGVFSLYLIAGDLAERLRIAADTDSLTGAPNRRAIEALGTGLMTEARSAGSPLSLAICDVDHFKEINDYHGHGRGDDVLCSLTRLFREQMSDRGHFGRFGGEEFVLIFPGCDPGEAERRVEDLRRHLMAIEIGDAGPALTASFGVTGMIDSDQLLADLIARADQALYASKQGGRNRTTVLANPATQPSRSA